MNCSGKHAAMLATCLANDWPLDSYLEPTHPLQLAVVETLGSISGDVDAELGIDGCGLPIVPLSLTHLARAFARLVTAEPDSPSSPSPTPSASTPTSSRAPARTTRA